AELPENPEGQSDVDWMALQQAAVLVDEELYLLAGRLLADASARRPDDPVLQTWQRWVARMAASPAQLPSRKKAAQYPGCPCPGSSAIPSIARCRARALPSSS